MDGFAAALATGISNFSTVWTNTLTMIVNNEALMIFLVAGLIGTAFRIFKRAKKSVR